ncbi:MAG: uracil phosphoribosyltransferase [Roseivirga sp.]
MIVIRVTNSLNHVNLAFQKTYMFALNQENSVANNFLAELRDTRLQQDRLRFRTNLKRLGHLLAYEISKTFSFESKVITTPLADTTIPLMSDDLVLIPIMRAALPFYEGFLEVFDQAGAGFIGAWRVEEGADVEAVLNYQAAPDLTGKTVIVIDPMLATGKSLVKTVDSLMSHGTPKSLHLASVIAAPEGIDHLKKSLSMDYHLWTCAVDEKLNDQSYIVPGLGDAGDLSFGTKL